MDHGAPWWSSSGPAGLTALGVFLLKQGIRLLFGAVRHPQTQGKVERFHRTLKAEVLHGREFADLGECQRAFDRWRPVYNYRRPHQALEMATPSERYRPSARSFPESLPPIEYSDGNIVRKADKEGTITFKSRRIRLGKPFRSEAIALRPSAEDGVFSIHFCRHQIGTIDLRSIDPACGFVDIARAMPTSSTREKSATEEQTMHPRTSP